ncbi:uncharacterized protein VTP21DRAFT_8098 [Calcarisporiella thermophila]|uniref:uncharacterized protein n=1 Tax=Calcarisporiella thermophila TaxID=911321 RepID=UPI003743445D
MEDRTKSALDRVVNKLVTQPNDQDSMDLDQQVADLILQEARNRERRYQSEGVGAFLGRGGPTRMNKRFLINIVKQTDDHNQALITRERERERALRKREYSDSDARIRLRGLRSFRSPERIEPQSRHQNAHSENERKSRKHPRSRESRRRRSERSSSCSSSHSSSSYSSRHSSRTRSHSRSRSRSPFYSPNQPSRDSTYSSTATVRGRGTIGGSRMDRYFTQEYDPTKDVDPARLDSDGYILNLEDLEKTIGTNSKKEESETSEDEKRRKKRKKEKKSRKEKGEKRKKKSKKKKRKKEEREESSEDEVDTKQGVYPKIREWDRGKLASGEWEGHG